MARRIEIPERPSLDEYEAVAHLAPAVRGLRSRAAEVAATLEDRTIWMVNSTARGGGVAEMLPTMISMLRELDIAAEWVVLESEEMRFFDITKTLHNLIHGSGSVELGASEREVYEEVNRTNAEEMKPWLSPGDILIVHDPQPMALAGFLNPDGELSTLWRCHIGLDESNEATRAAWKFLAPYAGHYERGVFSTDEYVPDSFEGKSTVVYPAIDPLSPKNRELSLHKIVGILANAALSVAPGPVLTPMYRHVAQRLQPYGEFAPANMSEDIGLLSRPVVTQISRWDRLKGWEPLLDAFTRLKEYGRGRERHGDLAQDRRLELVRLVMAGPDPDSVADDPEGREVLELLCEQYMSLPPHIQRDVALVALPMKDLEQNALMVNAIQRASSIVLQNSFSEGFGLTVTEGMWKCVPVLTNRRACGPRQQVRHEADGYLIENPEDSDALCRAMAHMLSRSDERAAWGRNAQRRVHDHFLVFAQLQRWMDVLEGLTPRRRPRSR